SRNLDHDRPTTEKLAAMVVDASKSTGMRIAVVGVGGLSGSIFREQIVPRNDKIHNPTDDRWNRQILRLIGSGDVSELRAALPGFVQESRADMGMKHLHWILGALGGRLDRKSVV